MLIQDFNKLIELQNLKNKHLGEERKQIILEMVSVIKNLFKKNELEKKTIQHYLKLAESADKKDFNVSEGKFLELQESRDMVMEIGHVFREEFTTLKAQLFALLNSLIREMNGKSPKQNQVKQFESVMKIINKINSQEKKVEDYIHITSSLVYDKGTLKTGQVISRIIRLPLMWITTNKLLTGEKTRFILKIQGVENIPEKEPCIIAPHHHHSAVDPAIIKSIVRRPVFFMASTENFVIPVFKNIVNNMASVPFRRNDAGRNRLTGKWLEKRVVKQKAQNVKSIKKILKHLSIGHAIIIFPEEDAKVFGNTYPRGKDEEFITPKSGFVYFSVMLKKTYNMNVPIIPIGIKYKGRTVTVTVAPKIYQPDSVKKLKDLEIKEYIIKERDRIFSIIKELSS